MTIQLAVVTDIHHGADYMTKKGDSALELTRNFVDSVNASDTDAVLELGDRISDVDHDTDSRLTRDVVSVLRELDCPRYHINGNHDLKNLTLTDTEALLGQSMSSQTIPLGAWDLVLWRADPAIHSGTPRFVKLPPADLEWLRTTLNKATRPQLVVTHIPVSPQALTGNYYFERAPEFGAYPESAQARAIMAAAKVPVVCLSGHVHWNTLAQDQGVFYLTQQSLTESYTTPPYPAAAWGTLTLGDQVTWAVHGRDRLNASFNPGQNRWLTPLQAQSRSGSEVTA